MNRACRLTDTIVATTKASAREYCVRDSVCTGLALRVLPSGAKSWILRGHLPDKTKRSTLGSARELTVADARKQVYAILSSNRAAAATGTRRQSVRFDKFVATYESRRKSRWKASTAATTSTYVRTTLIPAFGTMPMSSIRNVDVHRWFHAYGAASPGGANRALSVLKDIFGRALDWGALPPGHPNPCNGVKRHRRPPRGRVLNADAIARLWTALDQESARNQSAVDATRLLMITGCRVGEILSLRWDDVGRNSIYLRDAKAGPRTVELPATGLEILNSRIAERTDAWVFPGRCGKDQPMTRIQFFWKKVREKAGLPSDIRLHDLRHTFASVALMGGETMRLTGELLGHRNTRSTARYAHLRSDFLLAAAESVGQRIASMMSA